MLISIIFITSGKYSGESLRESGQHFRRLRKTCKKAVLGTIPFSFGRVDTSIATESVLNVHFIIYALVVNHEVENEYSALKTKAFRIQVPSYLCETGFSAVARLKTKYRSQLNIENELRVSISNTKPSFEKLSSARQTHGSH
ncbi:uncharacterized protein TNCV_2691441 [Trichonephila clavipes]|uniref:Uncharacterized protein n=1 Tax=Trichonephila clavipes TaxID=2585209 RepID=A0A8X6VYK9_TRICX|nr:uncharacterized protein TNCV_2691441 [Trichonephila clavipes]